MSITQYREKEETTIFPERNIFVYGSFGRRLVAAILDGIIIAIPNKIISSLFGNHDFYTDWRELGTITTLAWSGFLLQVIVNWCYYALMESGPSQATIGKMALSLKVTNLRGERVTFAQATGRHFGKILSSIILLIGYFMMLWDERSQTLHDKMAGTLVLRKGVDVEG